MAVACVHQHEVGALPGRDRAAIREADGGRRGLRDQAPGFGERRSTELCEPERREQGSRIVVVGREDPAPAAPDHFGRIGPAGVAAAAHHVRARRTSADRRPRPPQRRSPRWWGIRRRGSRARDSARAWPGWCRHATAAARRGDARPRRAARSRPARRRPRRSTCASSASNASRVRPARSAIWVTLCGRFSVRVGVM